MSVAKYIYAVYKYLKILYRCKLKLSCVKPTNIFGLGHVSSPNYEISFNKYIKRYSIQW